MFRLPPSIIFDTHFHMDLIRSKSKNLELKDCLMKGDIAEEAFLGNLNCFCLNMLNFYNILGGISNYINPSLWSQGNDGTLVDANMVKDSYDKRIGMSIGKATLKSLMDLIELIKFEGCHPHHGDQMKARQWQQMENILSQKDFNIVAVGEIGNIKVNEFYYP